MTVIAQTVGATATEQRLETALFGSLRYSCVWEDHRLLEEGLAVGPGDDVLSICSAGCNVLNLLLSQPRSLVAIDLNKAQTAQLRLKVAAARRLSWRQFVDFLGAGRAEVPQSLYPQVRPLLSAELRDYWDQNLHLVEQGLLRGGALEKYFEKFRTECIEPRVGRSELDRFLEMEDLGQQQEFFEEHFRSAGFREDFGRFFNRQGLSSTARHPEQFRFVTEQSIDQFFYDRFEFACTRLPAVSNFYLHFFLTSRYRDAERVPPYLRQQNWDLLRDGLDRLEIVDGSLSDHLRQVPAGTYSKANLSDLCEYLAWHEHRSLLIELVKKMRSGGRIAFWNLLVPRPVPRDLSHLLRSRASLASRLWSKDRVWFYRSFHIEEVLP